MNVVCLNAEERWVKVGSRVKYFFVCPCCLKVGFTEKSNKIYCSRACGVKWNALKRLERELRL